MWCSCASIWKSFMCSMVKHLLGGVRLEQLLECEALSMMVAMQRLKEGELGLVRRRD